MDTDLHKEMDHLIRNPSDAEVIIHLFGPCMEKLVGSMFPISENVLPCPKLQIKAALCVGLLYAEDVEVVSNLIGGLHFLANFQKRSTATSPEFGILEKIRAALENGDMHSVAALTKRNSDFASGPAGTDMMEEARQTVSLISTLISMRPDFQKSLHR